MGYSLYVSGAQQFVPAFYKRLFFSGSVAEAARAGRQAMRAAPNRACLRGEFELQDWLVPVVYGQEPLPLTFKPQRANAEPATMQAIDLPEEAKELGDYGFIGRERAVLDLERALRLQPQAGLLIHGMAGIGKTTLVKGFLHWMNDTNGLQYPPFWFHFDDIRSAEFVINRLLSAFFDTSALAAPMDQKINALIQVLSKDSFLLVWDNFESAAGIAGTEVAPQLPTADRQVLDKLLTGLRGGKTKVLITSRSPEKWLSIQTCFRLPLGGLAGEERWQYCNAVVRDLGLTVDRSDPSYADLMQLLGGHPLAMRAVLLRLPEIDAAGLKKQLEQGFAGAEGDESSRRIDAALNVLTAGFPPEFNTALQFIGLHQRNVDIDCVEAMSKAAEAAIGKDTLRTAFAALENAGLLHHLGRGIYSMHPALSGFLRGHYEASDPVRHGFVYFMGSFADSLAAKQFHEQRVPFAVHGGSFHHALALARQSNSAQGIAALTQALAAYSQNSRDYSSAQRLFAELAEHDVQYGNGKGEAAAYHQLGIIAEEQRDFKTAESWYKKSLAIKEKQGDEHGAASTYHQLGIIAEEQRDFKTAESWYKKSLAIKEKQGDEHGAASTYGQLGLMAMAKGEHGIAGQWLTKAARGFLAGQDQHSLTKTARIYIHLLRQAPDGLRAELIASWNRSNLRKCLLGKNLRR